MSTTTAAPLPEGSNPTNVLLANDIQQDTLRKRKRAATQLAIRRAAIGLGLEYGYENVTVDMICSASNISARTFFNYFGNKEGAYVSPRRPPPSVQQHRAFVEGSGTSVFADLFTLITSTFLTTESNMELFQAQHRLIQATPELLEREKARISETEEIFVAYVLERFGHNGRTTKETPDLHDEARMVVALVSGALRFAVQKWAAGNFTADREQLLHTTAELIQRITVNEHWP